MPLESEEKMWQRITWDGERTEKQLDNDSLGGGDGTYNGRWWPWSVDTLKKMLDEAGLEYRDGEDTEAIGVYI